MLWISTALAAYVPQNLLPKSANSPPSSPRPFDAVLTVIRRTLGTSQSLGQLEFEPEEAELNMAKVLVLYDSAYGHFETMAHAVAS